jgi:hypothetical protein
MHRHTPGARRPLFSESQSPRVSDGTAFRFDVGIVGDCDVIGALANPVTRP